MRKKLDTRFPAARIKKIMQTDEDVGKIALAVPLLVSKALELFLQDLCDRTYEITVKRGAKTMNSLHLKQCVHTFNMFDFLKDTVSKVPELGGSDATGEDRSTTKRKKVDDEETDSDEELKMAKMYNTGGHSGGSVRGRGRGRGRGRPRGSRNQEKVKYEDCSDNNDQSPGAVHDEGQKENLAGDGNFEAAVRNFDLNVDLNENEDSTRPPAHVRADPYPEAGSAPEEDKHEEYPGWSVADMEKMAQLATLNRTTSEEDEDYDEEEEG